MSMHQSKRSVVANCSDIAKVVCDALQFRHQRAQPYSAAGNLDAERAFDRAGESDRIGDRAVAGRPRRQSRRPIERSAGHQRLDAFVRISQPFLKANDRLAACMKTKMPRLYNASMHRADRNLMQPFSLGRQESVRRNGSGRSGFARQAARGPAIVRGPARAADRARRPAHSRTNPVSPARGGSLGYDKRRRTETFLPRRASWRSRARPALASSNAIWTAPASPQSPARVRRPSPS